MTVTNASTSSRPRSRYALLLAAAAALAVVGVGTLFAINRSQPTTILEAADDAAPETNTPVAGDGTDSGTDDSATDDNAADDNATDNGTDDGAADSTGDGAEDEEMATGISADRSCYSDGNVVLTIDIANDGSLTGWQVPVGFAAGIGDLPATELHLAPNGDRLLTLSGVATTGTDLVAGPYRVAQSSVAAFRNGFSTISTSQWIIVDDVVTQPSQVDEVRFPAIDCAESADDLAVIEATPAYYPPEFPVGLPTTSDINTTAGQNRVCYNRVDGSGLLVFDFTDDGMSGNALQPDAFQTISATKTFDGENTYNVATLILGDQENARDTVTTALWEITPERITTQVDGEELRSVDCATVADQVAQAETFLDTAPYAVYPLGS